MGTGTQHSPHLATPDAAPEDAVDTADLSSCSIGYAGGDGPAPRRLALRSKSLNTALGRLELLSSLTGGVVAPDPGLRAMLALVEAALAGQAINVKCLESHYDGARSSFHLFLRRLVGAGVVSIAVDERDRRGRLVSLAPTTVERLIGGLEACDLILGDPLEIACTSSPRFARALDLWRRLRGYAPLPTLAASDLIAIADAIDGASTHIVERVTGASLDFRFLHVGAVGESERRLMGSDLLSSLPDDEYRERVLQSYRGTLEAAAPSLSSVALATRLGTLRYRRLILPFAEDRRAAKHLVVVIEDPEPGRRPLKSPPAP